MKRMLEIFGEMPIIDFLVSSLENIMLRIGKERRINLIFIERKTLF